MGRSSLAGVDKPWSDCAYRGGVRLLDPGIGWLLRERHDGMAGHVPLTIGSAFVTKPHIDSGRMRPLAVTTSKRSRELPDVPTLAESGFPGFEAPAWWAVLAPAKTPPEVVKRMNEELNKIPKQADIAKKLDLQGIDVVVAAPRRPASSSKGRWTSGPRW